MQFIISDPIQFLKSNPISQIPLSTSTSTHFLKSNPLSQIQPIISNLTHFLSSNPTSQIRSNILTLVQCLKPNPVASFSNPNLYVQSKTTSLPHPLSVLHPFPQKNSYPSNPFQYLLFNPISLYQPTFSHPTEYLKCNPHVKSNPSAHTQNQSL